MELLIVNEMIDIALAADGRYFDQLLVTATSMATYARKDAMLSFNILDGGITSDDWQYFLEKVQQCHPACKFNRIFVDENRFAAYPKWNGNRMAYARLLLPDVLQDVDWILYSDCDFLWLRDVVDLWQERDESSFVVAVRDEGSWNKMERVWFEQNGYDVDGNHYFCSGMCLFNLKKIRSEKLLPKVSEILSTHPDIPYVDQTALNIACAGSVKLVSQKWMCFTHELTEELHSARAVIHHAGEVPWKFVRRLQQLSDTMLMWHDFNAKIRGITRWQSLRKRFSIRQIVWHRMLALSMRFILIRVFVKGGCYLLKKSGAYRYLVLGSRKFKLPLTSRKLWQIAEYRGTECNAGPKAPGDVERIVSRMGARCFFVRRTAFRGSIGLLINRAFWFLRCRCYRLKLPCDSTIFVQYPSAAWSKYPSLRLLNGEVKKAKNVKIIVLIHDLRSLRRAGRAIDTCELDAEEMDLLSLADKIIVHNETMAAVLSRRGVSPDKLIALGLFDYLTDFVPSVGGGGGTSVCSVAIAGNLNMEKSGYLRQLAKIQSVQWHLYGPNYDANGMPNSNVIYEGCWPPEELPAHLKCCFGLVWDGMSVETCSGGYGEYLRINNPHKLSLYLTAGLPVIVWRESAVAQIVEEKGLGICVDSLSEISDAVAGLEADRLIEMWNNVRTIGAKVRNGDFIREALRQCLERLR